MILEFDINGHKMGEIIADKDIKKITVMAVGTTILEKVEILKNNQIFYSLLPEDYVAEFTIEDKDVSGINEDFYYIKVVQADGEMAWSSPIWIKHGSE